MNFQTKSAAEAQKPARMRTIRACYNLIKQEDPDTGVTINYVRQLAVSGKIPTVKAGNKYLINYDLLCEYLANPTDPRFQSTNKPTPIIQGIRRITRQNMMLGDQKYIHIPESIYSSKDYTHAEKIVFGLIFSLSRGENGFCWMSTKNIAEKVCTSEKTVNNAIQKFKDSGLIEIEYEYYAGTHAIKQRHIYINSEDT